MRSAEEERIGVWVNLLQVHHVIQGALEQRLKAAVGLSLPAFEVLVRLSTAPGGHLKMIDIANLLLASKSGVTKIVDRLEEHGLAAREIPRENRRIVYTRITPAGLAALRRARPEFLQGIHQILSRHLSDADIRTLRRALRKLLEGNGVWEEERCSLKLVGEPGRSQARDARRPGRNSHRPRSVGARTADGTGETT